MGRANTQPVASPLLFLPQALLQITNGLPCMNVDTQAWISKLHPHPQHTHTYTHTCQIPQTAVAPLGYHLLGKSLSVGPPALPHSPPHLRPVSPMSFSFNINLASSPRTDPSFVLPEAYTVFGVPFKEKGPRSMNTKSCMRENIINLKKIPTNHKF